MYNLLIADDEELERRTIRSIVIKGFEEIFNIYEAKNGREAIEIADKIKPDIIIMDIKMPGINGIEAIKEIRKFLKEGYFIILTAYDYFDYAKEAIEYDVKEYMLKPFKRNEFTNKLEEAIRFVENTKLKRRDEIVLKEKIYTLIPMMENELCYSIISENLNNIDYKTYLGYLGMTFENGYCIVLRINNTDNEKNKLNMKFKINDFAREYLKRQNNAISSCTFTNDIIIFMETTKNNDVNEGVSNIEGTTRKIIDNIKEKFDLEIFVGIGRIYSGIEKLSRSYKEALITVNSSNEELNIRHFKDLVIATNGLEAISTTERNLLMANGIEVFGEGKNIIMNAVEYINSNYRRDIMLEEVANYINISSFYFSKIFKEYTGKNYVDYITDLRIEIAKEKLRLGSTSIKEICYEVGYNDPNYFSRVFKKSEGLSPTDYKIKYSDGNK